MSSAEQQQQQEAENAPGAGAPAEAGVTTTTTAAAMPPSRNISDEGEFKEEIDVDDGQFVNQGLRLWEQSRTRWLGHKNGAGANNTSDISTDSTARPAAVPIEVDEIIEVVFAMPRQTGALNNNNESPPKFPRTVPLPQMVDILVDLWEAEGLDI